MKLKELLILLKIELSKKASALNGEKFTTDCDAIIGAAQNVSISLLPIIDTLSTFDSITWSKVSLINLLEDTFLRHESL